MKILEQYTIRRFGENFTVKLYTNGEHRCSCNHFHAVNIWGDCPHITAVKNNTAIILEAQRFETK